MQSVGYSQGRHLAFCVVSVVTGRLFAAYQLHCHLCSRATGKRSKLAVLETCFSRHLLQQPPDYTLCCCLAGNCAGFWAIPNLEGMHGTVSPELYKEMEESMLSFGIEDLHRLGALDG